MKARRWPMTLVWLVLMAFLGGSGMYWGMHLNGVSPDTAAFQTALDRSMAAGQSSFWIHRWNYETGTNRFLIYYTADEEAATRAYVALEDAGLFDGAVELGGLD